MCVIFCMDPFIWSTHETKSSHYVCHHTKLGKKQSFPIRDNWNDNDGHHRSKSQNKPIARPASSASRRKNENLSISQTIKSVIETYGGGQSFHGKHSPMKCIPLRFPKLIRMTFLEMPASSSSSYLSLYWCMMPCMHECLQTTDHVWLLTVGRCWWQHDSRTTRRFFCLTFVSQIATGPGDFFSTFTTAFISIH